MNAHLHLMNPTGNPIARIRSRAAIVPVLACPRCLRRLEGVDAEQLRTMLECYRRECQQRWWAMCLEPGLVEPQVAAIVAPDRARELVNDWGLPPFIEHTGFWQIKTSQTQALHYEQGGSRRLLEHFHALFRAVS